MCTLRVEGAGVALEVPPREVHEDPLPLLRLAGEREPRQERAQRRVQRRARQLEVAHVLLRHRAGELVAGQYGPLNIYYYYLSEGHSVISDQCWYKNFDCAINKR